MAEENQHIILTTLDNDEKKIIRREVEKQRRTQMSLRCATLRSSLPFELIKGKRSASDHIGEAVNYIQFLKQKINALEIKRDRLKQVVINSSSVETEKPKVKCVNVSHIAGGVEIVICSGLEEGSSTLSELLEILLQEGCEVVSCVSTHANGRIFHTIKSEVDLPRFDLARLQHKLDDAILLSRYSREEHWLQEIFNKPGLQVLGLFIREVVMHLVDFVTVSSHEMLLCLNGRES